MQQDDQNTFKNPSESMKAQNTSKDYLTSCKQNSNPIQKRNLISQGFNIIIPAFWYQQLIELNHTIKDMKNMQLPSFETYINFLNLLDLQNPTESAFHHNQRFPKQSPLFGSDFLEQFHYLSSKTLQFSKIKDSFDLNQIQWTVVNPILWNLIEWKYHLQNLKEQLDSIQRSIKNELNSKYITKRSPIQKIAVFFTKEFIHEKGRCKGKEYEKNDKDNNVCFVFKNVKYTVPCKSVNEEISRQLTRMNSKTISITLIIDQALQQNKFFTKVKVSGFFASNLPFKEFLKGLIGLESLKNGNNSDKFYIYDQFGQKISRKIALVENFTQISERKRLMICTSPLDEIINAQATQKINLVSFLKTDFNYPDFNEKENFQNDQFQNSLYKMTKFFDKLSKEKEVNFLSKTFSRNQADEQNKPQSTRSGFKPYDKEANEIKILSGTFYRSDDSVKSQRNENNRENDEVRYLDSATTNLDTPTFQHENQSEKAFCHTNYENVRLKKHSSYNRAQRKKKSLNYIQRKKKNNYILRGTATNNAQTISKVIEYGDYKKRVKFPLFHSLCSLEGDPETLQFILQNMRKLAQESIYHKAELIKPALPKSIQTNESKQFASSFETTQTKTNFNRKYLFFGKQKNIVEIQRQKHKKILQQSLQKIVCQIERFYEPQIELEKGEEEQKGFQKSFLDKDNEEIKTIIDNSEGPYSEVEKNSFKIKYRRTQKSLQKKAMQNDEIKSMSDGLNPIEDNEQTI